MKTKVKVDGVIIRDGRIKCLWHGNIGFGELDIYSNQDDINQDSIYKDETNSFKVTTECMGEEFYHMVLLQMVEYLKHNSIIIV